MSSQADRGALYADRIRKAFHAIFEDPENRFYFEGPDADTGYMLDTGNIDARTEGMSYGMMMAVQMDRQDIFDRLWTFSVRYMRLTEGKHQGYFAWSVKPDGRHNAEGPAPDGEEYFAMALFFAEARWGGREAPYDYAAQARDILMHCVHQHELVPGGRAMWVPENHLIRFVPEVDYSDPSYHLPHFYTLFAKLADEEDREFWAKAAEASYAYLEKSCDPVTGMAAEYADYDGKQILMFRKQMAFYSDAYRVAMNIGLDACWFGPKAPLSKAAGNLQKTLREHPELWADHSCMLDASPCDEPVMHPLGLMATTAAGSLALPESEMTKWWTEKLLSAEPRTGVRRYYDNCLYFFTLLMMAGEYKMYL